MKQADRQAAGIDTARLNAGESERPSKKRKTSSGEEGELQPGMRRSGKKAEEEAEEDEDGSAALTKKLVQSSNFTQQANVVDVDKHMMAFIEEELKKRRAKSGLGDDFDTAKEIKKLDPRDELYSIAEQYRIKAKPYVISYILLNMLRRCCSLPEGNVTLSTAMLTAIPEVDLGIDNRLKNIEETEKAKRALFERQQADAARQVRKEDVEADNYAASRFYRAPIQSNFANNTNMSDAETLRLAREAAARGEIDGFEMVSAGQSNTRQTASDETVVARFKARTAGHNPRYVCRAVALPSLTFDVGRKSSLSDRYCVTVVLHAKYIV